MSKFTPGPWCLPRHDEEFGGAAVVREDGFLLADCNVLGLAANAPDEDECFANARLIAAAPALYAACKAALLLLYYKENLGCGRAPEIDTLEAALAKADGGAQ